MHRVAVNHLLDRKRSAVERYEMTFGAFADDLHDGLVPAAINSPELDVLAREVKHGCTLAMLTCLDRDARVAYVLGEVFGISSREGAWICDTTEAAYRQRLSRARTAVRSFVTAHCGLVSPTTTRCHCRRRVPVAVRLGRSTPPPPATRPPTSTQPSPRWNVSTTPLRSMRSIPGAASPEEITAPDPR